MPGVSSEGRGATPVSILLAILWALLWALAGLLVLLLLVLLPALFVPFDCHIRLDSDWSAPAWEEELTGAIRWLVRLRWGWVVADGLFAGEFATLTRSEVRICGLRPRLRPRRTTESSPSPKRERKRKPPDPPLLLAMAQEFARFVQRLVRSTSIRIQGDLTYGFGDPAVTGWCEAVRWSLPLPVPVELDADFSRPALIGSVQADGRTSGYRLIAAAWRALANPVIRGRLAEKIPLKPIRNWIVRGGTRKWQTSH